METPLTGHPISKMDTPVKRTEKFAWTLKFDKG